METLYVKQDKKRQSMRQVVNALHSIVQKQVHVSG